MVLLMMENSSRRNEAVRLAVEAADRIILEASNGTNEETNYLTSRVMMEFAQRVHSRIELDMVQAELKERIRDQRGEGLAPDHNAPYAGDETAKM